MALHTGHRPPHDYGHEYRLRHIPITGSPLKWERTVVRRCGNRREARRAGSAHVGRRQARTAGRGGLKSWHGLRRSPARQSTRTISMAMLSSRGVLAGGRILTGANPAEVELVIA